MKDYVVVVVVTVMIMFHPVRGFKMQLNISCPGSMAYLNFSLQKIGTLVCIVLTREDDLQIFSLQSGKFALIKILKLPNELEQSFGHVWIG